MQKYEEKLEKCIEKILPSFKEMHDTDVCNWGFIFDDYTYYNTVSNACHWDLKYGQAEDKLIEYIYTSSYPSPNPEEDVKRYIHWLVNDSLMSKVFISKDADRILKDGMYIVSTEYNNNYTVNAIINTRLYSEYPEMHETWISMVDNGCNPNIALFLCCMFQVNLEQYEYCQRDYHTAFCGYHNDNELLKFLSLDEKFDYKKTPYKYNATYDNINNFFNYVKVNPFDLELTIKNLDKDIDTDEIKSITLDNLCFKKNYLELIHNESNLTTKNIKQLSKQIMELI